MTNTARPNRRITLVIAALLALAAGLLPTPALAAGGQQSYMVVMNGAYALDGSYALGKGYALVGQDDSYALDGTYALGRQYALYALDSLYALLDAYALTDQYALTHDYRAFGQYALDSTYALDEDYALGSGYALAVDAGSYALDDSYALADDAAGYALGGNYALLDAYALDQNYALARDYALAIMTNAGGVVTADLSHQIGVMVGTSKTALFAQTLSGYALVKEVGVDISEKHMPSLSEALSSGQLTLVNEPNNAPQGYDLLEQQQWSMAQIRTRQAQAYQLGRKAVRIGVVDSGIDGNHEDFKLDGVSNVDCQHGADFTADGPGIGNPLACVDNNFHGTHVAGIIAARRNGIGVVGVAPNVTLIPIKVCDANGSCYVSDAVQGITYAGDLKLNAINMSFFVDDDTFNESTEFKCATDATQKAYLDSIERALAYARGQGVSLISALGNSDKNLADPPGGKKCKTVPPMSPGVNGTVALGPNSEKASYSSWGSGFADVSAPGGNGTTGNCLDTVLSTLPSNLYGCIQGTSMASPHTTGVVALIISQFGKKNGQGQWVLSPDKVRTRLQNTTIDLGAKGYDKCFGYGRIDALRAVRNTTSKARDTTAPACTEPN
ncbi:MAG TPA: S8 family serine peptidase [Candidatus Limnocylindria bacterium]|nr:S8 family serine peptidase [Candidatus Limnocylindria bacterium]